MVPAETMKRYEMVDALRAQPNKAEQACRNLWAAVLAQAAEDFLSEPVDVGRLQLGSMGRSRRYAYGESLRNQQELMAGRVSKWLFEDSGGDVGSFPWICEALGLDRGYVRQHARARKASKGRPMRTFMTVS